MYFLLILLFLLLFLLFYMFFSFKNDLMDFLTDFYYEVELLKIDCDKLKYNKFK